MILCALCKRRRKGGGGGAGDQLFTQSGHMQRAAECVVHEQHFVDIFALTLRMTDAIHAVFSALWSLVSVRFITGLHTSTLMFHQNTQENLNFKFICVNTLLFKEYYKKKGVCG